MSEVRLIDANALKKAIFERQYYIDGVGEVYSAIDNAPTVEPTFGLFKEMLCTECAECENAYNEGYEFGITTQRPQGEWIICNQDNEGIHKIECPFCKHVNGNEPDGWITFTFDRLPPFCENCGADMGGEKNE